MSIGKRNTGKNCAAFPVVPRFLWVAVKALTGLFGLTHLQQDRLAVGVKIIHTKYISMLDTEIVNVYSIHMKKGGRWPA